jgi:hypothetical protein
MTQSGHQADLAKCPLMTLSRKSAADFGSPSLALTIPQSMLARADEVIE